MHSVCLTTSCRKNGQRGFKQASENLCNHLEPEHHSPWKMICSSTNPRFHSMANLSNTTSAATTTPAAAGFAQGQTVKARMGATISRLRNPRL